MSAEDVRYPRSDRELLVRLDERIAQFTDTLMPSILSELKALREILKEKAHKDDLSTLQTELGTLRERVAVLEKHEEREKTESGIRKEIGKTGLNAIQIIVGLILGVLSIIAFFN